VCLSHDDLSNHFKTNFMLMRHHKYSLTELEMMLPWERDVHIILLLQALEEEKRKREQEQ